MANSSFSCVMQQLQKLIGGRRDSDRTDGELLECFVSRQDEAAFETLVRRHGPLVQRVCRRVLGDAHAAEDAFQASFLLLARKAVTIRARASVGGWLYEVAYHLAVRAKSNTARRAWHERQAAHMSLAETVDANGAHDADEIQALLDEELRKLPEKYRTPLVLCYLEGKTNVQAARELNCPAGTMSSLLQRGRDMLRGRLAKRGVALSVSALTALLAADPVSAGVVSNALVRNTVQAAVLFAAGETAVAGIASSQAVFLAEGMLNTMISAKLKFVAALLLAVGLVGTGTSLWVQQSASAQPPAVAPLQPPADAKPADARPADLHGDPLPEGALARMGTVRWRHPGPVSFVGYANEGKHLVTGCDDGIYRVWDVATSKEIRQFGKANAVADMNVEVRQANGGVQVMIGSVGIFGTGTALSPDGTILAALGKEGIVRLWDVNSGKDLRTLVSPQSNQSYGNMGMVFTPDGKGIAVRGDDQSIRLYGVEDGKEIRVIAKPQQQGKKGVQRFFYPGGGANSIAFAPDGKTLAVVAMEHENNRQSGVVQFHDVEGVKEVRKIKGPQNAFNGVIAFARDGKTIAWSIDSLIRLLECESGKEVKQFGQAQQGVYHESLLFSPDGKTLASRANNGAGIHIWDVENGKAARILGDQPAAGPAVARVYSQLGAATMAFSPDGKVIAEGLQNSTVRLWGVSTGKETLPLSGHHGGISSLSVSPDGKTLTTHAADGTVRRWDMATGKELSQFKVPSVGGAALLSTDGKIVVYSAANDIHVWDSATGKEVRAINVPNQQNLGGVVIASVLAMALSPDGKIVAVRGADLSTRCFDTQTGKEVSLMSEQPPANNNPNGNLVFVAGSNAGRDAMVFSPDGATLATVAMPQAQIHGGGRRPNAGTVIRLWDVKTGKPLTRFDSSRGVEAVAFAPDGRTIATANVDHSITLWEVLSGKECLTISFNVAQAKPANSPADSVQAVIIGGMQMGFPGQQAGGSNLAFAADGRTLALTGADRSIRLFELPTGKEVGKFTGHGGAVLSLAFAPDNKTIVTGSADTSALVWAGGRFIKKPAVQAVELEAKQLETLWEELAGEPTKAYQARVTLATAPTQTLALLEGKVKPTAGVDPKQIEKLIAELESNQFEVREKAATALEKLGELAQPTLQKLLDNQPSLETRQRVDRILEQLTTGQAPPPEVLRNLRAVQLLEQMGSAEAKQLLRTLANGAAGDKLTRGAESALKRLAN